jgi:hypothetical protein
MRASIKIWLDDAPEVEIRDGFAYVIDKSGEQIMERVMSIQNLRTYIRNANGALDEWEESAR